MCVCVVLYLRQVCHSATLAGDLLHCGWGAAAAAAAAAAATASCCCELCTGALLLWVTPACLGREQTVRVSRVALGRGQVVLQFHTECSKPRDLELTFSVC